nr:hypothetical protein [Escherichia coli]
MLKVFFYVYLNHYETESEINVLRYTMLFILAVVGGAPTQKLAESQLTIMCKLGLDDEINFAKISFLSHLTQNKFHYPQNKQLTI